MFLNCVSRYSEIKDYTFGKEPSMGGPVTGHFTQVPHLTQMLSDYNDDDALLLGCVERKH